MIVHFYSTSACHLCDEALVLIEAYQQNLAIRLELKKIDIAEDEALVEAYGIKIPVIKRMDTSEELNWPFDLVTLGNFFS